MESTILARYPLDVGQVHTLLTRTGSCRLSDRGKTPKQHFWEHPGTTSWVSLLSPKWALCLETLCDWRLRLKACTWSPAWIIWTVQLLPLPTPHPMSAIESLKKTQTSIPCSRASCCCPGAQGSLAPSFSLLNSLLAIYNKLHFLWPVNVIYLNSQEPQSYWFEVTLVAHELSRVLSP